MEAETRRPTVAEISGIDPETWAALEAMPCPYMGDVYACTCRPGAWEWTTRQAVHMRYELETRGYVQTPNPDFRWRVRWARPEPSPAAPPERYTVLASPNIDDETDVSFFVIDNDPSIDDAVAVFDDEAEARRDADERNAPAGR